MLDIRTLPFHGTNQAAFQKEVDLSYVSIWGEHPFAQPITVSGTLTEQNGYYLLEYQAEFTCVQPCARCLTNVERKFSPSFSHLLNDTGEDLPEDDFAVLQGQLDLTGLVGCDLLLELEGSCLCKPDCQGLCPVCGGDRNQKQCDCKQPEPTDPRFDVLRQLLNQ